ncbi:hypothetical protein CAOG_07382 [Capsaspora owczarzaki ATCC 30864]|uniref:C2 domain-containing protein n=1 Tax=Capsaspora owczarzaki (strain ATCC 30864) TaxID=595528 RepID=A0A0D2W056_CAPO3|nr:hypothetical protein CAOG_07382 [Capsaspora owczarzaki ATCC 30864]KJE97542.1 hypothetical protein CAOG_007382 [Capsaspora owczarzaki ATCC 30864]|eukprot:XP_004343241.2 hypothetical protein CAOG_07382 [Capsaspora owczarzaki ATCC 30864]
MPGILKVRVSEARDLPIMDRSTELTDAYVEVKFVDESYKTIVCKKTLCPVWNADFRFELEDEELQDDTLEIKVWDQDTISSDDAIGKVLVDLNPLLSPDGPAQIAGWFPIYDTLRGIRGEVNVSVKLDLISDVNKFRDTSLGVRFFAMRCLPPFYRTTAVHGFVEELIVDDDPEHQFIDNFRTQRSSNEARQRLFAQLSGELRRKIGLKTLEMGGNAVTGYQQSFDIEQEFGIVARAIGTACTVIKPSDADQHHSPLQSPVDTPSTTTFGTHHDATGGSGAQAGGATATAINIAGAAANNAAGLTVSAAGSPSDPSGLTVGSVPLSSSLPDAVAGNTKLSVSTGMQRHVHSQQELPLITIVAFPKGVVTSIGGVVAARSVKLLDKIHNPDEPVTRDKWWIEIREEIRAHARAMGCSAVVGYSESSTVCGELCLLSGVGTAVILNWSPLTYRGLHPDDEFAPLSFLSEGADAASSTRQSSIDENARTPRGKGRSRRRERSCISCHVPFKKDALPFKTNLVRCAHCKRALVPDVIFATIEPPAGVPMNGQGCIIEARMCRPKKKAQGEANATLLGEATPFIEYELHRQLLYKLKLKGLNALFALKTQITVGESLIVGVATATAVFLSALPAPPPVQFARNNIEGSDRGDSSHLDTLTQALKDMNTRNRPEMSLGDDDDSSSDSSNSSDDSDDDGHGMVEYGDHAAFVVEVDDDADMDTMAVLFDPPLPEGFHMCTTQILPPALPLTQSSLSSLVMTPHSFVSQMSAVSQVLPPSVPMSPLSMAPSNYGTHSAPSPAVLSPNPAAPAGNVAAMNPQQQQQQPVSQNPAVGGAAPVPLVVPAFTVQALTAVRRVSLGEKRQHPNKQLAAMFHGIHQSLWFKLRSIGSCCLTDIKYDIQVPEEDVIQITMTTMVQAMRSLPETRLLHAMLERATSSSGSRDHPDEFRTVSGRRLRQQSLSTDEESLMFPMEAPDAAGQTAPGTPMRVPSASLAVVPEASQESNGSSASESNMHHVVAAPSAAPTSAPAPAAGGSSKAFVPSQVAGFSSWVAAKELHDAQRSLQRHLIEITSLSYIPNARLDKWLGSISLFLIKESSNVREDGGASAFTQRFLMEAHAMARAQVAAQGGNALISFQTKHSVIMDRNQSYQWVYITGDVVEVVRSGDKEHGLTFLGSKFKSF